MAYTTWHDFVGGETLTAATMDALVDNLKALFPVGCYKYLLRAATTSETLVEGCWLECNGVSVLRATYPDLNTLLSGLSYPFGSADGTHMTLPDIQGRDLVAMSSGGHADVNALGDSDGVTKANRTPKHNSTNSLTVSGSPGGTFASSTHVHTIGNNLQGTTVQSGGGINMASDPHQHTAGAPSATASPTAGTLGVAGTIGPGGTRPIDTGTYLVGGCWFVKAIA